MEYQKIHIKKEQYEELKRRAEENGKTIIEIIDSLLQAPKEEPTPQITSCIWDYYYYRPKKDEYGKVEEWEKVSKCPILSTFPDLLQLPPQQRISVLMKACNTCIVKEKSLKQKERKKERKRQYLKEYGGYKSSEYEPDYKLY